MTRNQAMQTVLELDPVEQELLLAELSNHIHGEAGPPISSEWLTAIHRRADELRSGKVKGIAREQVHQNARDLLAQRRFSK